MLYFIIKMVDKTTLVTAVFVAAVLAGLFVQFGMGAPTPATKETFMQQEAGMPLNAGGIGPYDGTSLGTASGWASSEPLPVGTSPASTHIDSNKLMLLSGNKVSADCCPSAFNTDTGCVCLTEQDQKLFASRGGNKA
jgi:hypothetical protein